MMILSRLARRFMLALIVLVAMAAGPAFADPSLWVIKDRNSTIYLFGTIHVLKPQTAWRPPVVAKALTEADDVVMEIEQPENPKVVADLMERYGVDPKTPLSQRLDPKTYGKLQAAATSMGFPPEGLDNLRPWRAALTVSLTPLLRAGYDPDSGVEKRLTALAAAQGKPVSGLETLEQQIRFFADLPPNRENDFLKSSLDEVDGGTAQIDALVAAWAAGDQKALREQMVDDLRQHYPSLYRLLLVDRNRAWAQQLKTKLAGSGVTFVAVGAGHLTGPDSLQVQLAKLGIKAKLVEP